MDRADARRLELERTHTPFPLQARIEGRAPHAQRGARPRLRFARGAAHARDPVRFAELPGREIDVRFDLARALRARERVQENLAGIPRTEAFDPRHDEARLAQRE